MDQLPDGLLPSVLIDRRQIADEVTRYFYPLTERKTRELPLNWCFLLAEGNVEVRAQNPAQ